MQRTINYDLKQRLFANIFVHQKLPNHAHQHQHKTLFTNSRKHLTFKLTLICKGHWPLYWTGAFLIIITPNTNENFILFLDYLIIFYYKSSHLFMYKDIIFTQSFIDHVTNCAISQICAAISTNCNPEKCIFLKNKVSK